MVKQLVIAGTHSGVGKTTLTAGLITALRRRGLVVQPFKVGPDFIDPTHHSRAAGRPCRNLDTWMLPPPRVRALFERDGGAADVAVIEGVMGLYDGLGYDDDTGSTAEVAKLLAAPVILVVDAARLARSAGAVALGYQRFDPEVRLAGFIVNRAGSASHGAGVAAALEKATGLPVLGWLPRDDSVSVPERHLGLVPVAEPGPDLGVAAGDLVARCVNLERVLEIADDFRPGSPADLPQIGRVTGQRPVVAVARDEAFHFTYEDNLELLRSAGAELVFFSPVHDQELPARTAGVLLSGGFPEIYAAALSANRSMHAALRAAHARRLPIYAECGGLMYLTEAIVDIEQRRHAMVGLLPGDSVMTRRVTLGYRLARAAGSSWLLHEGETVRGHEFHYSAWHDRPAGVSPAFVLSAPRGDAADRCEGAQSGSLWASYVHLHFGAKPELAERFVAACARSCA